MFIIITGNPIDGFQHIGPFDSDEAAIEYADTLDLDWFLAPLHSHDPEFKFDALLNAAEAVLDSEGGVASMGELAETLYAYDNTRDYRTEFPNV